MTVIFSKKCELALQAVLLLSTKEKNEAYSSGQIAEQLKIPKEFVSKVLQELTKHGIISSRKGNSGGFFLGKDARDIRLIQIVEAIDGLELFNKCVLGFPNCSSEKPCPVHNKWGKLRDEAFAMMTSETLAELRDASLKKITNL